jgi:hypothetical protein
MKKTALLVAALLALALFWTVPAFPGPIPSSVVPNGARWVAHLDMEKFVATNLYGYLDKSGAFEIKSRDIDRWLKIDIPKDVTGVTVFGLGDGTKDDIVIAVAGKFDKPGLLALIAQSQEHKEILYGGTTIYSSGDEGFGAFVNDNLIVLSESQAGIQMALDTAAGKAKNFSSSALSTSLKDAPSGAFLSGVIPNLSGLGKELGDSKVLEQASGVFFLAQEAQDNLLVRIRLTADTPENAKNMADIVQGLIAMGRMSGGQDKMSQVVSLLDGLHVKQDGRLLKIDFERPSKEIADLITHGHGIKGLLD